MNYNYTKYLAGSGIIIIGICGNSGSGKSTLAQKMKDELGGKLVTIIDQDSYYKDLSHMSIRNREKVNYDHPEAIENNLLIEHLTLIKNGKEILKPIYNFSTHTREIKTERILPTKIIIVEGIHIYFSKKLRDLINIKIFLDVPTDICFIRRLLRDMKERGRSVESIVNQYYATVRPMQEKYILPSIKSADIVFTKDIDELKMLENIIDSINKDIHFLEHIRGQNNIL